MDQGNASRHVDLASIWPIHPTLSTVFVIRSGRVSRAQSSLATEGNVHGIITLILFSFNTLLYILNL